MGLRSLPDFRLTLGDDDLTAIVRDRLKTLTVTDNDGEESDTLEIVIDDRDNAVESPPRGRALGVSMGYRDDGLFYLGRFTVDEVQPEGPPDILTIRAKAADMREGLKVQRTRAFRNTTIGAIVSRIADENGLQPAVATGLAGRAVAHRDQANESDLHFLTRLGREYGAVAAPKDGKLIFAPTATGLSASGQALTAVTLTRADLTSWRVIQADRDEHGKVRARWRDTSAGRTKFAEAGSGDPVKTLRNLYPNEAAAKAAAEAELTRLKGGANGVELTLPGRPEIVSQTPITVTGLRAEFSGEWIVKVAVHTQDYESSGFITVLTGRRKAA